jgi:hypothetical protein
MLIGSTHKLIDHNQKMNMTLASMDICMEKTLLQQLVNKQAIEPLINLQCHGIIKYHIGNVCVPAQSAKSGSRLLSAMSHLVEVA